MAYEIEIPFEWPVDWAEWIQALDAWLATGQYPMSITTSNINDIDTLVNFALENGFAVIRDDSGAIVEFVKMNAVDPSSGTEALPVPVEEITESLEVAGAVASYTFAGGASGLIDRAATVGAVLSLMTATITGLQVAESIRNQLIESVTPYTKDGEHVAVYYGKHNGQWKTYLPEDVITAVRNKAVELGVFTNGTSPSPSSQLDSVNIYRRQSYGGSESLITISDTVYDDYFSKYGTAWKICDASDVVGYNEGWANGFSMTYGTLQSGIPVTIDKVIVVATSSSSVTIIAILPYTDTPPYTSTRFNHFLGGNFFNYVSTRYYAFSDYDKTKTARLASNTSLPTYEGTALANGLTEYISNMDAEALYSLYLNSISSSGVDGVTPTSILPADTAKTLADLLPDAWANKVALAAPTDSNIFNKKNYLPTSIETENPFADGTSQTTSEAQTGDIEDPLKTPLINYVNELITQMINDPDNPIPPTYPAGDSGDTPPANPTLLSGSANGLWKIYNPLLADIQAFGSWLWSSSIIDQITRMFASPIDAVIALHQIYCTPVRGEAANIKCGYLDSGVQSTYTVANQYQTIDCGDVVITEYYGTAVDYYKTKINIYLPFIGIVPLDPSVVMGSVINVTYRIDVLTGTCIAQIKVNKQNSNAVMYTFPGNCACQIPLTGTTYTGMVSTLIGLGNTAISVAMDNPFGVMAGAKQALQGAVESVGTGGVRQSGYFGSNAGALGIRKPYVIITHPVSYDAYLYNSQYGFPSNKTVLLGSLSGYTKVKDIHLSGISCTDDELEEIERLLKEGVIIN